MKGKQWQDQINMTTHQTSTDKTCSRTDQNGKKYAQHHIQGQNDQYRGQQFEKNEVVMGRAH